MKKFNINYSILVKLTSAGIEQWRNDFNKYAISRNYTFEEHYRQYTNNDGYTTFQLHQLMSLFGSEIDMRGKLMFETNILINESDLKDI